MANYMKRSDLSTDNWRERQIQKDLDQFFDPDFNVELFEHCARTNKKYYTDDGSDAIDEEEAAMLGYSYDDRADACRIRR